MTTCWLRDCKGLSGKSHVSYMYSSWYKRGWDELTVPLPRRLARTHFLYAWIIIRDTDALQGAMIASSNKWRALSHFLSPRYIIPPYKKYCKWSLWVSFAVRPDDVVMYVMLDSCSAHGSFCHRFKTALSELIGKWQMSFSITGRAAW